MEALQSGLLFLEDWGNEGVSSLPLESAPEDTFQVGVVSYWWPEW